MQSLKDYKQVSSFHPLIQLLQSGLSLHCCTIAGKLSLHFCTIAGKFWHISDLHYDPNVETQDRSCLNSTSLHGRKWRAGYCDSDSHLINSTFAAMREIEPHASFILCTGYGSWHRFHVIFAVMSRAFIVLTSDLAPHYRKDQAGTQEEVISIITKLSLTLNEHFPTTRVFPSLGKTYDPPVS